MITLNHHTFTQEEIQQMYNELTINPNAAEWEMDIYRFILQWLDQSDYIEVKTSGSTGEPRVIRLRKEWMEASALQTCRFFSLGVGSSALLCLPVAFIAGKMMIVRAMVSGFNLIITEPSADPFTGIDKEVDFAAITPQQLSGSLHRLQERGVVKTIIVGGGEISPALMEKIKDIPVAIYATYGMTETSSHVALRKVNGPDSEVYYTTLGATHIRTDDRGCLLITNADLFEDTLITNDLVEIIDDSSFRWIGRFDNIINSGGIKIVPEEVEQAISHLRPQPMFISAIAHEALGEAPVLIIEGEDLTLQEKDQLLEGIKKVLSLPYVRPRGYICMPKVPTTANGKVDRVGLKRLLG